MSELEKVEWPLVLALRDGAHEVRRQVVCEAGRIDIFDDTTGCIIECKAKGDPQSLAAAMAQLQRYYPHFVDPQMAIAVPRIEPEAKLLAKAIRAAGIQIIEVEKGVGI